MKKENEKMSAELTEDAPSHLPNWFRVVLDAALAQCDNNVNRLARETGLKRPTIDSWRKSSLPSIEHLDKLLEVIKGNIWRALPERLNGDKNKSNGAAELNIVEAVVIGNTIQLVLSQPGKEHPTIKRFTVSPIDNETASRASRATRVEKKQKV